ncbi:MAG: hypothetical protein HQK75_14255 [Candidatus Magnetomorum sp.]|nr:hypothetical protein [Candidatus Magnetomorum sp.]
MFLLRLVGILVISAIIGLTVILVNNISKLERTIAQEKRKVKDNEIQSL